MKKIITLFMLFQGAIGFAADEMPLYQCGVSAGVRTETKKSLSATNSFEVMEMPLAFGKWSWDNRSISTVNLNVFKKLQAILVRNYDRNDIGEYSLTVGEAGGERPHLYDIGENNNWFLEIEFSRPDEPQARGLNVKYSIFSSNKKHKEGQNHIITGSFYSDQNAFMLPINLDFLDSLDSGLLLEHLKFGNLNTEKRVKSLVLLCRKS